MRVRGPSRGRVVAAGTLAGVAVAAVVTLGSGEDGAYRVSLTVPAAANVFAGQEVRAAGRKVGKVASLDAIEHGRAARLTIQIDDPQVRPLRHASRMTLRWGGTISYANRFVELDPGRAHSPAIANGGTLRTAQLTIPVEFDELLTTFTPKVRRDMKAMVDAAGPSLGGARVSLRHMLTVAPPLFTEASNVLSDLDADELALQTAVRSTDRVVRAVDAADPGIGALISDASTTFRAIAGRDRELEATISAAPPALRSARRTLAHADTTLTAASDLTARLAPGIREARKLTNPLTEVLRGVVDVGPDVRSTLTTAGRATHALDPLLAEATTLMPTVGSVTRESARQLACVRPYAPEIVALFTNWADYMQHSDRLNKYFRVGLNSHTFGSTDVRNSAELIAASPGLTYAFPRPPGFNSGQPWFLPECGAGKDALDPAKDPEARSFAPGSKRPLGVQPAAGSGTP